MRISSCWVVAIGLALLLAGCGPIAAPSSTPTPTVTPTPSPAPSQAARLMTPAEADATIREAVTGARPVLLPTAIVGSDWRARVRTTSDGFSVTYTDPSGTRTVSVAEGREFQAQPALPVGTTTQAHLSYHGDSRSFYQVNDSGNARSARALLWHEPGTYDVNDPSYSGVPCSVTAIGLTDAEFQQLVGSLR